MKGIYGLESQIDRMNDEYDRILSHSSYMMKNRCKLAHWTGSKIDFRSAT